MTAKFKIGIDLGGTKIECLVLNGQDILFRERISTESNYGSDHILNQINIIYKKALNHINFSDHHLGICTPGSISKNTGLLQNSNTTCLNNLPIKILLEKKLDHMIKIDNDANCFALAESTFGAAIDYDFVFGIIMGTGCGGGFVINNKVRLGPNLISGEWGHSILHTNGSDCYCGKNGCVETYISGSGIKNILQKNNCSLSPKDFFNKTNKSKTESKIFENFINDFGQAIGNIINSIDPDIIVLGGGISNNDFLYHKGIESVHKYIFSDHSNTVIVKNKLGDSAGVFGAAML